MSNTKTEAQRLADWLDADACDLLTPREAAAELRRLDAENQQLRAQLDQEVQQYKVDAERYRWLKGRSQVCMNQVWIGGYTTRHLDGDFLSKEDALSAIEAAIDAAIRARSNT